MAPITLYDIAGQPLLAPFKGIVDSGADGSMFKLNMLASLGIALADCEECKGQGMGGETRYWVWKNGGQQVANLKAECLGVPLKLKAQFCESPFILLGREDFFKVFDVVFHQQKRTFVLDEI